MRRLALSAVTGAAAVVLSGCQWDITEAGKSADCPATGRLDNPTLVLMAQAVPTAALIPCVRSMPAGWHRGALSIRSGRAAFILGSDREGQHAVTVEMTATCDVRRASEVPSDQTGTRRYERPTRVTSGYGGDRYYVYAGGCTRLRFDFNGRSRAQPLSELATAVAFVTRDAVRDLVRRDTRGRLVLDPTPTGTRS
jgi:hypothetical protein